MEISNELKSRGLRPTPHRIRIAQKVLREHGHFTAEEISNWGQSLKVKLSRATVYNILNEFVSVGLLKSMYVPRIGKTIYDSNTGHHYHLYDLDTGRIHDVDPRDIKVNLDSLSGFEIEDVSLIIAGRKL